MRMISLSGFFEWSWLLRGELRSCSFWTNCWTALVVVPRLPEPRPVVGFVVGLAAMRAREMVRIGINNTRRRRCMRVLLGGCYFGGGELWWSFQVRASV